MPDYTITPNPETHEFIVTLKNDTGYRCIVTLFPKPKCRYQIDRPTFEDCSMGNDTGCPHTEAVERALIDARNAPERPENKLLIETAYIPLKVAHKRSRAAKKGISDAPIDEAVKRQDWMD